MDALVLDMDGVVVDSEPYWQSHKEAIHAEVLGVDVDGDALVGRSIEDQHGYLAAEHDLDVDAETYYALHADRAETIYREQVDLLDGLPGLLDRVRERGAATAVASSSPGEWVDLVVDRFGLGDRLDAVVGATDVEGPSKPAPDIYEHAASRVGVDPADALAVEDSTHGVAAAARAGYATVGYRPPENEQDLSAADAVATSPRELREAVLDRVG